MSSKTGPTLRAQWLGARLRELRESRRIKNAEVGELLNRHPGTISRFESGIYPISSTELMLLLDMYGVNDLQEREELIRLSEEVAQRGWWDGYTKYIGTSFADYVWLENRALDIHVLDINAIPGLLQTADYASALITNGPQREDKLQTKRFIEARLIRSRILTGKNAPRVRFLVHEGALHQRVGGDAVMAAQLQKLRDQLAANLIELRLLPLDAWGHTAATVGGGFTIFELPEPYPDVACTETMAGMIYLESPDIDAFTGTYDALWNKDALDAARTVKRINALLKDISP